jgi:pimeloyl-ACP methyl ester carboxylesterase
MCDDAVWAHQADELRTLTTITIADPGLLDSLGAMADAILDHAPQHFAIAGHSMGGRVAFEVFRRAPERLTGIALMDTAFGPKPSGAAGDDEAAQRYALLEVARKRGTRAMGRVWVQKMVHPERLSDEALLNSIIDMIGRKTAEVYAAQIKALLERPDATPLMGKIHCPTMVLCGRQDSWSVLSQHERMADAIPHSRLVVIEECGHMSTIERPNDVTAALKQWLTSL